jgi:alanine racemase
MDGQLSVFQQAVDALHAAGCETGVIHAAGSYAMLHSEFTHLDAVRAGSILLGRCRRRRGDGLSLVGHGETTVDSVRWLPKGHTVGGGHQVTLKKPTRVAVIPVGYQNGFGVEKPAAGIREAIRRVLRARRRTVRIGKQKAKVLGAIGASETLVNVTGLKCGEGDLVVFDLDPLYAKGMNREYR